MPKNRTTEIGIAISSVPLGSIFFGISGYIGKYSCSFFNSSIGSAYGTFSTFAGIGALAAPMAVILTLITNDLFDSPFWTRHPHIRSFLESSLAFVYVAAALTASAALLGSPVIPTMVPMLIIPAILWASSNIMNVFDAFRNADSPKIPTASNSLGSVT